MTTIYQFVPSNKRAPSFLATFDSNQYTVTIIWNVSSRRYFVKCVDQNSNLIFFVPLIESETNFALSLLEWDEDNSRIIGTTETPHNFIIGQMVNASIVYVQPSTYNGNGKILILNETQFSYSYPQNPGQYLYGGSIGFLISMTDAYFNSTLVFRNMQFEVTP